MSLTQALTGSCLNSSCASAEFFMNDFPITVGPGRGEKRVKRFGIPGEEKRKKKFNNELSVNVGISPKYIEIKFYFLNLLTFMGDLG